MTGAASRTDAESLDFAIEAAIQQNALVRHLLRGMPEFGPFPGVPYRPDRAAQQPVRMPLQSREKRHRKTPIGHFLEGGFEQILLPYYEKNRFQPRHALREMCLSVLGPMTVLRCFDKLQNARWGQTHSSCEFRQDTVLKAAAMPLPSGPEWALLRVSCAYIAQALLGTQSLCVQALPFGNICVPFDKRGHRAGVL